jgi:hypothetical protein
MQEQLYKGELVEHQNNRVEFAIAWENFCLQVIITALEDDPTYINTEDCMMWLDYAGVDNPDVVKNALVTTQGKINDKRYINERMEE